MKSLGPNLIKCMQILNSQETFVFQKSLFLRFDLLFLAKVSKVSCMAHQNCCKDPIQSFGWVKKWFWAFLNNIIFGLMTSSAGSLTSGKIALFGTFSLLICKPLKVATLCFQQNVEKDLLYAVKKTSSSYLDWIYANFDFSEDNRVLDMEQNSNFWYICASHYLTIKDSNIMLSLKCWEKYILCCNEVSWS